LSLDSRLQTLRFSSLIVTELGLLLAVGWTIAVTVILPKGIFHFHELIITTYTNGTMDFSTDATALVRSLGTLSLLTLILGLVLGTAMGLTTSSVAHVKEKTVEYDHALTAAGFVKITSTPDGVTYRLTEHGRQFLRDYAFLNREAITVHESDGSTSRNSV
jgi:hypothetical protein